MSGAIAVSPIQIKPDKSVLLCNPLRFHSQENCRWLHATCGSWFRYRYCLGPYRKRRGHVKGSAGAQRKGVAAVVSIRCDEGSLSGLAGSCYAF